METSALTHLEGSLSGERYDADVLQRVDPTDGRSLLARYDLDAAGATLTPEALRTRPVSLWRWTELLPVRDPSFRLTLGEGAIPVLPLRRLGEHLGTPNLLVKAEGLNPTGSFKARGMAVAVARNRELGATHFVVPSAGNAGGALAAYAAAAGAPATVVMPVDAPEVNQAEVVTTGARLILVEGLISDAGRVAHAIAERTGAFDVSTLKEPYRVEGKKTMGLELVEQLGWRLPDVIVYPTGGGTGLIGMWKAFDELERLGLIGEERPRMVAVQSTGCAPIVRAFEAGDRFADPWEDAATLASGLRVPSAVGDHLILDALRESAGTAVAVDDATIDAMRTTVGQLSGTYVSPESAAAFAAVPELRARGDLAPSERVVVFDTGTGLKYPPPRVLPEPPVVDPEDLELDALLDDRTDRG
ncbi:MAG: threonine synthase [Actinobacteria bacterium]|nr:threonine synthase [Actinomycetota bacterium]